MISMIERVAKAMFVYARGPQESWEDASLDDRSFFELGAISVIDAMREPTEAMLTEITKTGGEGKPPSKLLAHAIYTTMIDAALSEQN